MAKRAKLLIEGSGIDSGVTHVIYRNVKEAVLPPSPDLESRERDVQKRMLSQTGEVLVQDGQNPGKFYATRVYSLLTEPTVYIDGVVVTSSHITWDPRDRSILLEFEQIEPGTQKIVSMDYEYLASMIEDDFRKEQEGVSIFHRNNITGVNAPLFVEQEFDHETGTYRIKIERNPLPEKCWYWVSLREDITGRVSDIVGPQYIEVAPNEYDLSYRVQRIKEDNTTEDVGTFTGYEYILDDPEIVSSSLPTPVSVTVTRLSPEKAEISFRNPWYKWEELKRPANTFQIREEDADGETSDYTIIPVAEVSYKPVQLKIRRKQENGSPAMFEGDDALDISLLTEADVDINQEFISFIDDHLAPEREYSYTFYLDDEKGLRSLPFMGQTNEVTA